MNALANLSFNGKQIRTMGDPLSPWFCLVDVCNVLGMRNSRNFPRSAWCHQDGVYSVDAMDTLGRTRRMTFIDEGNLYALALRSERPQALEFHRWVTRDVLPTIRKTGAYAGPTAEEHLRLAVMELADQINELVKVVDVKRNTVGKTRIRHLVNCVSKITEMSERSVWGESYRLLTERYGLPLTKWAREGKCSTIEAIEANSCTALLQECLEDWLKEVIG